MSFLVFVYVPTNFLQLDVYDCKKRVYTPLTTGTQQDCDFSLVATVSTDGAGKDQSWTHSLSRLHFLFLHLLVYEKHPLSSSYALPRLFYSPSQSYHNDSVLLEGVYAHALEVNDGVVNIYETPTPGFAMVMNPF